MDHKGAAGWGMITSSDGRRLYWPCPGPLPDALAQLLDQLDLQNVGLAGHSTGGGGGEGTRYLDCHGTTRMAKAVLVGAIPPLMLKTDANRQGALIIHGDDDQIVPHGRLGSAVGGAGPDATLKESPAPHGLAQVAPNKDQHNADLLDDIRS
jgi:pimeloyl-ACP methyl ester carboxylesterase